MKIKFLAHSSFLLISDQGTKVITDPYKPGCFNNALRYKPIKEVADIVLISHDHDDHNYTKDIVGSPKVIKESGFFVIKDVEIKAIHSYHDTQKGIARGTNLIFVINIDGLRVAHLGDLGHDLDLSIFKEIGPTDILLAPVGGYFTIDAKVASNIFNNMKPKVMIPMHYKTTAIDFPIAKVDEFLKEKQNVKKISGSEITITKNILPQEPEIWVLKMANE
ncbi:MAG: MBL fold metallo-hydrolase [candidate division WOR-3 bacterium]|nr:MBL fold metallo-hydrolase [candidate division WOR-3 bacterium]MCX7757483.1 MBL fold metallo-hydrolase [candidate division WOR-3 bacterium]MDW7987138.1 MBL fold metallo-hydrolase [candidate division WOR-3 bacterium]